MIPYRVQAPIGPVVPLADLRLACRIDGNEEDSLIEAFERAAVAKLDGYRGILGRCIISQQWAVDIDTAGTHALPLPDVISVTAESADGEPVAVTLAVRCGRQVVTVDQAAKITMTCAIPDDLLEVVRQAIRLLVAHWYLYRETVAAGNMTEVPLAFHSLAGTARRAWV